MRLVLSSRSIIGSIRSSEVVGRRLSVRMRSRVIVWLGGGVSSEEVEEESSVER